MAFIFIPEYKQKYISIKIVVDIPKEIGNDIQDLREELNWELLIQEENGNLVSLPNTYDDSNIVLYIIILILSILVTIYSIIRIKMIISK